MKLQQQHTLTTNAASAKHQNLQQQARKKQVASIHTHYTASESKSTSHVNNTRSIGVYSFKTLSAIVHAASAFTAQEPTQQ